MSEVRGANLPKWFWIIAIAALLWNLMGVFSYLSFTMISEEALAAMPDAEQNLIANYPVWATAAFAIAVFAGIAGSVLLLLRKSLATPVFAGSLAAIVVQMTWWLGLSGAVAVYGPSFAVMPALVIIAAAFLLWFAVNARGKGWLG